MSDYAFTRADLVAPESETKWYEGSGILESAEAIKDSYAKGDWFSVGANGAAIGLSAIGAIVDPLQAVLAAGVGWLMEHLSILRAPLDWLAGDPKEIEGQADTWRNIRYRVDDATNYYVDEVDRVTATWASTAADAYRHNANNRAGSTRALGTISEILAEMTLVAGGLIGVFRSTIRDLVADAVGAVISKALQSLLVVTIPKVIAEVALLVGEYSARILRLLKQLVTAIRELTGAIPKIGSVLDQIGKSLGHGVDESLTLASYRAQSASTAMRKEGSRITQYRAVHQEISSGHRPTDGDNADILKDAVKSSSINNALQNAGQLAAELPDQARSEPTHEINLPL